MYRPNSRLVTYLFYLTLYAVFLCLYDLSNPTVFEPGFTVFNYYSFKPWFPNASVLDQFGFRTINSRFLPFKLRTLIRITTKPSECKQTNCLLPSLSHEVKTSHDDYDITQMIHYNSFATFMEKDSFSKK